MKIAMPHRSFKPFLKHPPCYVRHHLEHFTSHHYRKRSLNSPPTPLVTSLSLGRFSDASPTLLESSLYHLLFFTYGLRSFLLSGRSLLISLLSPDAIAALSFLSCFLLYKMAPAFHSFFSSNQLSYSSPLLLSSPSQPRVLRCTPCNPHPSQKFCFTDKRYTYYLSYNVGLLGPNRAVQSHRPNWTVGWAGTERTAASLMSSNNYN
jgi:hypothetical protein